MRTYRGRAAARRPNSGSRASYASLSTTTHQWVIQTSQERRTPTNEDDAGIPQEPRLDSCPAVGTRARGRDSLQRDARTQDPLEDLLRALLRHGHLRDGLEVGEHEHGLLCAVLAHARVQPVVDRHAREPRQVRARVEHARGGGRGQRGLRGLLLAARCTSTRTGWRGDAGEVRCERALGFGDFARPVMIRGRDYDLCNTAIDDVSERTKSEGTRKW